MCLRRLLRNPSRPGRVWLLTALVSLLGCGDAGSVRLDGVAEVEPTVADAPDSSAAKMFRELESTSQSVGPNASWPQLFGPDRTSAVDAEIDPLWDADGPEALWSIEIGTGYGSPVVDQEKVVFNHRIGNEEIVQCVDASTGQTIWEHRYPTSFETEYEYSNGPYSTPVLANQRVYAVGGQGQFFCLDLNSGQPVWSRDLHGEYGMQDDIFAVGSTPLLVGDRLIFNLGAGDNNAGVIALDRSSGETLWEATDHGAGYCSPFSATIHDQPFVFVVTDVGLVSMNPQTGQVDWVIEHRSRAPLSYNAVSPLVDGDKVLVVTGPGPGTVCVRILANRNYEPLWNDRRVIDCQFNSLLLHDGHVYGFTSAGQGGAEFRCVDFETGQLRWKYRSLLRRGQGLIAGKAIVLLGERGHLASLLLNDESPQVLSFTESPLMSEPAYCAPALAAGRLYLKDEQRLACFDLAP